MDIIILCGGLGTRLKTISKGTPKSLICINKNILFLDIILKQLSNLRPSKIYLSLFYKPELFQDFIRKRNLKISYVIEKQKLDTGGAIQNILKKKKISNNFMVMNGDTFLHDFSLKTFLNFFRKKKKSCILIGKVKKNTRYSNIYINRNNEVISFQEKKIGANPTVNLGFYIFKKKDFNFNKETFSLERDFLPKIVKKRKLLALINNKGFIDIGVPNGLKQMKRYYSSKIKNINKWKI